VKIKGGPRAYSTHRVVTLEFPVCAKLHTFQNLFLCPFFGNGSDKLARCPYLDDFDEFKAERIR
jgi:hypothetical protein